MAKIVRKYKKWTIKATTPRDCSNYGFWVFSPDNCEVFCSPDWECDSLEEAISWIDNY